MKPNCGRYILVGKTPVLEPDLTKWGSWMQVFNRHVAKTIIGQLYISTVFLGLDHNFYSEGPPVLWETMIFNKSKPTKVGNKFIFDDIDIQERYTTYAKAKAGHNRIVKLLKAKFS